MVVEFGEGPNEIHQNEEVKNNPLKYCEIQLTFQGYKAFLKSRNQKLNEDNQVEEDE